MWCIGFAVGGEMGFVLATEVLKCTAKGRKKRLYDEPKPLHVVSSIVCQMDASPGALHLRPVWGLHC